MMSLLFPKNTKSKYTSTEAHQGEHSIFNLTGYQEKSISNRQSLNHLHRIAKLGLCLWLGLQTIVTCDATAQIAQSNLSPDPPTSRADRTYRVQAELSLKGNLHLPENALISKKLAIRIPIQSTARFGYVEQRIDSTDATLSSQHGSIRLYDQASATTTVHEREHQVSLREGTGGIAVIPKNNQDLFFANQSVLSREELDLLKLPVSSARLDALLPSQLANLVEGDAFTVDASALATAFRLTSVNFSSVKGEITSLEKETTKMRLEGEFTGNADQTATKIELIANLNYSQRHQTCTWLAIGIREEREISIAEPGFEIAATLTIHRTPTSPLDLPASSSSIDNSYEQPPPEKLLIEQQSDHLNFKTLTNRSWYMLTDAPGIATMRQIEDEQVISQCDFRTPPRLAVGKMHSPEDFQNEIVQKLGEQLTSLGDIEVEDRPSGLQVLRVTADGEAQGIPIRWVFLHFGDQSGRRLIATFTMEAGMSDQFSDSDRQIASSLRFLGHPSAKNRDSSGQKTENAEAR